MLPEWMEIGGGNSLSLKFHYRTEGVQMKVITSNYGVSKALLNSMKESFPNELPRDAVTPQQIAYLQGQQSIIYYLEQLYEETLQEN